MRPAHTRTKLFVFVAILALAALACGTSSGGGDANLSATAAALEATAAALSSQPTQPPAPAVQPTSIPAVGGDSGGDSGGNSGGEGEEFDWNNVQSGDTIYATDFDGNGEEWEDGWIWFTIPGERNNFTALVRNGFMVVGLDDLRTSVYLVPDFIWVPRGQDVYVEASFDNVGTTRNNNLSIGCRGTAEGWYEFSISSSGLWWIYKYTGNNNYTVLNNGGLANYNKNVTLHTLGASCIGDTMTFFVDGQAVRNGVVKDTQFREGQVFLSVYSDNLPDVEVEIDYFFVGAP